MKTTTTTKHDQPDNPDSGTGHPASGGDHYGTDRPPTKFRPEPRKLTPDEVKLRDEITEAFEYLDGLLQRMPGHSGKSGRAVMALEESHIWAMKDFV